MAKTIDEYKEDIYANLREMYPDIEVKYNTQPQKISFRSKESGKIEAQSLSYFIIRWGRVSIKGSELPTWTGFHYFGLEIDEDFNIKTKLIKGQNIEQDFNDAIQDFIKEMTDNYNNRS